MKAKKNSFNFEENLNKLKEISRKLESSDVSIEDSIKLYEEGISIYGILHKSLAEMERKVEILMDNGELENFDDSEE